MPTSPVTPRRYGPGVAGDRRSELVDAGLRLLRDLRFEQVLAAIETRAIAAEVDVTTGSFFHHFRTRDHFAGAVVGRFHELWDERVERLLFFMAASHPDGKAGVRPAAASELSSRYASSAPT